MNGGLAILNLFTFLESAAEGDGGWALFSLALALLCGMSSITSWNRAGAKDAREREFQGFSVDDVEVKVRTGVEPVNVTVGGNSYWFTDRSIGVNMRGGGGGGSGRNRSRDGAA